MNGGEGVVRPDDETFEVPQLDASPGERCYRALLFDGEGGVGSVETVAAGSDDAAIDVVRSMRNGHGVDLWERGRLIASFPPAKGDSEAGDRSGPPLPPRHEPSISDDLES